MSLTGLEVRLAAPGEVDGFSALMAAHHYLGPRGSGPLLRYIACLDGLPAVLATFGSAAWNAGHGRGSWAGTTSSAPPGWARWREPAAGALPAGRWPNVASAALAAMLRRRPPDDLAASGLPLAAAETFTDPARGTHGLCRGPFYRGRADRRIG